MKIFKPLKFKIWDEYGIPITKFKGTILQGKKILKELEKKYK